MTTENLTKKLVNSTKHLLSSLHGRTVETASDRAFFECFSLALKDHIAPLWKATNETYVQTETKQLFYFSMEYLMGRALGNNIVNLKLQGTVTEALSALGKNLNDIEEVEHEAGLGSGGLGRLASCFLDSLATMKLPGHGYGLRYRFGIFAQQIRDGYQIEQPDRWLTSSNPWETRNIEESVTVEFGGEIVKTDKNKNKLVNSDKVRAIPFDTPIIGYSKDKLTTINTLRLWSAEEEPRNFGLIDYNQGEFQKAFKNNTITYVLYPDDRHPEGKILRLKQQFFLVSSSLQDILRKFKKNYSDFNLLPEKVALQINDTHPTLSIPELIRILTQEEGLDFDTAWNITKKTCAYTNHTLMAEALETWSTDILKPLLPRQYEIIQKINRLLKADIKAQFPGDENKVNRMSIINNGVVKMAYLATYGSHTVNGVAALHSELLKENTLRDFYELQPEKFTNVTNGITPRRWLLKSNPELSELITSKIGDGWITDLNELRKIREFASDDEFQAKFTEIKKEKKIKLADFIKKSNPVKDRDGKVVTEVTVNPESLYDVQIKRLHEYKRQLLNTLHIMKLINDIKDNPAIDMVPRTFIFGAKASAAYTMAKYIIKLINSVARRINEDPTLSKHLKLVYVENYNVAKAELLFPAANLSEQISTASMEASGTGNMKFSLNGAMTIGTADGANVEMKEEVGDDSWPFTFGLTSDEVMTYLKNGTYDPKETMNADPTLKRIMDQLLDDTYARDEEESDIFEKIWTNVVEGLDGNTPDYFFVLKDFDSYVKTQEKVSELYRDQKEWTRLAIMNMAAMGKFSTDVSMNNYSTKIWDIKSTPVSEKIFTDTTKEFDI